jgi:miniconductance mechanosensitive channel
LTDKLSKVRLLSHFIEEQRKAIENYNEEHGLKDAHQIHARRETNIGLFRKYVEYYLKNNDGLNQDMTLMVRQLQPTTEGVPIELYCFSKTKVWEEYEVLISDIFDHLFAVVREFELDIHQSPTGSDFSKALK